MVNAATVDGLDQNLSVAEVAIEGLWGDATPVGFVAVPRNATYAEARALIESQIDHAPDEFEFVVGQRLPVGRRQEGLVAVDFENAGERDATGSVVGTDDVEAGLRGASGAAAAGGSITSGGAAPSAMDDDAGSIGGGTTASTARGSTRWKSMPVIRLRPRRRGVADYAQLGVAASEPVRRHTMTAARFTCSRTKQCCLSLRARVKEAWKTPRGKVIVVLCALAALALVGVAIAAIAGAFHRCYRWVYDIHGYEHRVPCEDYWNNREYYDNNANTRNNDWQIDMPPPRDVVIGVPVPQEEGSWHVGWPLSALGAYFEAGHAPGMDNPHNWQSGVSQTAYMRPVSGGDARTPSLQDVNAPNSNGVGMHSVSALWFDGDDGLELQTSSPNALGDPCCDHPRTYVFAVQTDSRNDVCLLQAGGRRPNMDEMWDDMDSTMEASGTFSITLHDGYPTFYTGNDPGQLYRPDEAESINDGRFHIVTVSTAPVGNGLTEVTWQVDNRLATAVTLQSYVSTGRLVLGACDADVAAGTEHNGPVLGGFAGYIAGFGVEYSSMDGELVQEIRDALQGRLLY